nr:hypothetical protein [Anaerolineae bacterium]
MRDERDERSIPELVHVAELRDAGNPMEAIKYAGTLMRMYPNNDLVPFMVAYIYYQLEYPEEAIKVAVEAIPKCKRKYRLYSVAGLAEFDQGKLPEALVWWARSIIAQCKVSDFQEHEPFLHVAHTADILGLKEAKPLFTMVDAIDPSKGRLNETVLEKLSYIEDMWVKKPFTRVINHIDKIYLGT